MLSNHPPSATFRARRDDGAPGTAWLESLRRFWPAYRRWYRAGGGDQGIPLAAARRLLTRHLPELVPLHGEMVARSGGDPEIARFLTLWRPPAFIAGCSQAVVAGAASRPGLVRNYDFGPDLFEATILRTSWLRPVLGSSECLWGLDDGVNGDGLAVSLTFGGSRAVGEGFGIPLILRYVLETCSTTSAAVETLRRVPCHMAYNVAVVDAAGEHRTVQLHPHRPAVVTSARVSTNHQGDPEWPEHAVHTGSRERERRLGELVADAGRSDAGGEARSADGLAPRFLAPGLYQRDWKGAFGTLYTVAYDCRARSARYLWPTAEWRQSLHDFRAGDLSILYDAAPEPATRQALSPLPRRSPWAEDWIEPTLRWLPPVARRWLRSGLRYAEG